MDSSNLVKIKLDEISKHLPPAKTKLEVFDNSMLACHALCPRKFLYRYILSLAPKQESRAAEFGSSIHSGLFVYYSGGSREDALKALILRAREETSPLVLRKNDVDDEDDVHYTVEFGVSLLSQYMENWPIEDEAWEVLQLSTDDLAAEKGFAFETPNGEILVGKIDLLVRMKKTGAVRVIDHKTTTKVLNDRYFSAFNPNNQIEMYLTAIRELLGETPEQFVINAIRVKQFKRGGGNAGKEDRLFSRCMTSRTDEQLDQRLRQIDYQIAEIRQQIDNGFDAFYMKAPESCMAFNVPCEYTMLCVAQTEELIQLIVEPNYVRREWSPYEIFEKAESKEIVMTRELEEKEKERTESKCQ